MRNTIVIRNGEMAGVGQLRSRNEVGQSSSLSVIGRANLTNFYHDGDKVGVLGVFGRLEHGRLGLWLWDARVDLSTAVRGALPACLLACWWPRR